MEKNNFDKLSEKTLIRIKDGKEVRDEQILLFSECALDIIEKQEFQNLPSSYNLLKEKIFKYRLYDKMDELEVDQAFSYGILWSSMRLIEIAKRRIKEERTIEVLAKKFRKNFEVFTIMKNSPGIKHKDLAERCNKTASELSQFFSPISEDKLFSFIRIGREKYYYLEDKGIYLLEQIEEQNAVSNIVGVPANENKECENIVGPVLYKKSCFKVDRSIIGELNEHESTNVDVFAKQWSLEKNVSHNSPYNEKDRDYIEIEKFYKIGIQNRKILAFPAGKGSTQNEKSGMNDISLKCQKKRM